ncbi:MAG: hypothetical protein ACLQDM_31380, partial [Bradyrhizobium sp.]
MTAPIASGWSGCRVGLAPTGKRRLCTAHTQSGHRAMSVSAKVMARIRPNVAREIYGLVIPPQYAIETMFSRKEAPWEDGGSRKL